MKMNSTLNLCAKKLKSLYRHSSGGLLVSLLTLMQVGCGQMAPGSGQGYVEIIDEQWGALGTEMAIEFYDVLRPSRFVLNIDRRPQYGEMQYLTNKGFIPMGGAASVSGHDLCNRKQDPYCKGLTFGEELLAHPKVRASIDDWLLHLCERVPKEVNDKTTLYYTLAERQREITRLRRFVGCDGAPREPRNIHVYLLRDLDDVFNGDYDHTDKVIRQSVIDVHIVRLNQ